MRMVARGRIELPIKELMRLRSLPRLVRAEAVVNLEVLCGRLTNRTP